MCLDDGIADLVAQLWRAGITTTDSCPGDGPLVQPNPAESRLDGSAVFSALLPHVSFAELVDLRAFYRIVLAEHGSFRDEFAGRIRCADFNTGNPVRIDSWLIHTSLAAPDVEVDFTVYPARRDINYVTELLARHNDEMR
jgi:hypothetical protein